MPNFIERCIGIFHKESLLIKAEGRGSPRRLNYYRRLKIAKLALARSLNAHISVSLANRLLTLGLP